MNVARALFAIIVALALAPAAAAQPPATLPLTGSETFVGSQSGGAVTMTTGSVAAIPGYALTSLQAGADWCAQVVAAYGAATTIIVNDNTGTCSADLKPPTGTVLIFQAMTYNLSSHQILPAGYNVSVLGTGWNTQLTYSGTGYAIDVISQPGVPRSDSLLSNFQLNIGTSAAGGIRYEQIGSMALPAANANHHADHIHILASSWTSGQVGVEFHTTSIYDANYRSEVQVETDNVDIGAQFQSDASVVNGSNANTLHIKCNAHTICVDLADGSDEKLDVLALGAHASTGTAIDFCGSHSGGYGTSSDTAWVSAEQGAHSTTIEVDNNATGCGFMVNAFGQSNDPTQFTDATGNAAAYFGSYVFSHLNIVTTGGFPAHTGALRLQSTMTASWRNNANSADIALAKNGSDQLTWNSSILSLDIASGTATLGSSAIGAGACATVVTATATGVLTTDAIASSYASAPAVADGELILSAYPTSGNVNFKLCNPTAGSLTPSGLTLNWAVKR